ncbi:MAG: tRNA lysidine(34) synthetase TilS [Hyphomicrobiaceae bacterium]
MDEGPLRPDEADALLAPLAAFPRLILAVSGGPDSTALMYLVTSWCRRLHRGDDDLLVASVDHGLRPESANEAVHVARQAAALGIRHRTLKWSVPHPGAGLQAAAREARYDLLHELWQTFGGAIVTAHTADDQAETLLMRLARGSGVDGLAAIPVYGALSRFVAGGATILTAPVVRPLLGIPRQRLLSTLHADGIAYIEDPSNHDVRFERVRVRRAMVHLRELGFTTDGLARTARRMQAAKAALDGAADALAATAVRRVLDAVFEVDRARLTAEPEAGVRLFRRLLDRAGGSARPAGLSAVEAAFERLAAGRAPQTFTLGGCLVDLAERTSDPGPRLRIYREPEREGGLPVLTLEPGKAGLWDDRFLVSVWHGHRAVSEVGPLGDGLAALAAEHPVLQRLPIPGAAARGLPAFREAGALVAVPTLAAFAEAQGASETARLLSGPCHVDTGRQLRASAANLVAEPADRPMREVFVA